MTTTPLFPIALSSQLDDTGVERVHATGLSLITRATWAAPPAALYLGISDLLTLQKSTDGGLTFQATPPTGVDDSTGNTVVQAGGRLYHWARVQNPNKTVTSTDGNIYIPTTGIVGFNAGMSSLIKTASEWQFYVVNGLNYAYASSNGVDFSPRSFSSGTVYRPVRTAAAILGIGASADLQFTLSLDDGMTHNSYAESAFQSSAGIQSLLATDAGTFIAFGRSPSNALTVGRSPTALPGSWSTSTLPESTSVYPLYSTKNTTGRLLVALSNGRVYYSDDDGNSWSRGADLPYASPPSAILARGYADNKFIWAEAAGAFFAATEQGSGINQLYSSPDGVQPWVLRYTAPPTLSINGIVEF